MVIGRYVLMHLPDPIACLRALVRYAKPDAITTFQDTRSAESDPHGAPFARSVQRLFCLHRACFEAPAPACRTTRHASCIGQSR